MATVTNYYEVLNLSRDLSTEEINASLSHLEVTWQQRMMQMPEKAQEMIENISKAKEVFKSNESRAEYDTDLEAKEDSNSINQETPLISEEEKEYRRWFDSALNANNNGDRELAYSALKKALGYGHPQNYSDCNNAAIICMQGGDSNTAIDFANEASLYDSTKYFPYFTKAKIYEQSCYQYVDSLGMGANGACISVDQQTAEWIYDRQAMQLFDKAIDAYTKGCDLARKYEGKEARHIISDFAILYYNGNINFPYGGKYSKDFTSKAKALIKEAYDLDPEDSHIQDTYGSIHGSGNSKKAGGCYVATAVYGSYDCPEVWVLRRYRDNILAETWYGRAFIHTYYTISPILVKWFGNKTWFKKIWKGKLDTMVKSLMYRGIEDTPYEDRKW